MRPLAIIIGTVLGGVIALLLSNIMWFPIGVALGIAVDAGIAAASGGDGAENRPRAGPDVD
jgi:hypothetical protein